MEYDLTFTSVQWTLVLASLVITLFALVAGFVYAVSTRDEASARYRPALTVSAALQLVAALSFLALTLSWIVGYDRVDGSYVPHDGYRFDPVLRYFDWSITVPLLTAELVGVSVLAGAAALRARAVLMASAAAMIVAGLVGEVLGDHGEDAGTLLVWGAVSTVPFLVAYLGIFKVCRDSAAELPADVGRSFRNAAYLLGLTWGVYPLGYLAQVAFPDSAGWGVTRQVAFSLGTIAAKVGFGVLAHKIAVLRTAYDVRAAESTSEDDVWLSSVKLAEGRPVLGSFLDQHSSVVDEEPQPHEGELTRVLLVRTTRTLG